MILLLGIVVLVIVGVVVYYYTAQDHGAQPRRADGKGRDFMSTTSAASIGSRAVAGTENGGPLAGDSRLAVARRLYTYAVTFISYVVTLGAVYSLLDIIDESWLAGQPAQTALYTVNLGAFYRETLAWSGGLLLVAVPLFLIHWHFAQRQVRREPDEAQSAIRKLFLYLAHAVAMGFGLVAFYRLITGFGVLAVGLPITASDIWPDGWLHALAVVVLTFLLARHWLGVVQHDGDFGDEWGLAGFWRRLYQMIAGLVGVALVVLGGSEMIQAIWQAMMDQMAFTAGSQLWRVALVNGAGTLIVGGYVWRLTWQLWQSICAEHPEEQSRGLRRFYLYGGVVIGALATLAPAAGLLEEILRMVMGVGRGDRWRLLNDLGGPVSLIPLGFAVWTGFWRYLRHEEARAPETHESETIRRVYYYTVAATGLALLWFGAVALVQAGLDRMFVASSVTTATYWVDALARGVSLLVVGAPIWALHWRAVERVARRTDEAGRAERASGPRRVYLYGVALVGAVLILTYLAQVAYRGFLWMLGDPDAGFFSPAAASNLAQSVIAAVLWVVHVLAIRDDGRLGTHAPQPTAAELTEVSADPVVRRAELTARLEMLRAELAQAQAELDQLDAVAPPPAAEDAPR